mgnify:CR=1 FL=1
MIHLHKRWTTIPHKTKEENKKPDTSKKVTLKRDKKDWDKVLEQARKLNEPD